MAGIGLGRSVEAESKFLEVPGATLHYIELGSPSAEPLVMIHGGGPGCTSWTDWQDVAPILAKDYRCLLLDLPQYGKSSKIVIKGPQFTGQSEFITKFLDGIGLEAAHFVCQSAGGGAALKLAIDHPERVRSLTLTSSNQVGKGVTEPMPIARLSQKVRGIYYSEGGPTPDKMRQLLAEVEWYDPEVIPEDRVLERFNNSMDPELVAISSTPNWRGDPEELGPIMHLNTVPTLIAWGDSDPFSGVDIPLFEFTRFQNPRFVLFKRASHHFSEEYPAEFAAVISGWLAEQMMVKE